MFLFLLILKKGKFQFISINYRLCYIKNMKKKIFLLALALITGCNNDTSYSKTCYQCFFGNEIELSLSCSYDFLNDKKELQNDITSDDGLYHFNYYVLRTIEEVNTFYNNQDIVFSSSDKELLSDDESYTKIVFIAQIPKGYRAFKRNNFQYRKSENEEIFLTSNFYTYNKRREVAYCFFDVIKNDEIKENYIYSFVIKIDKEFIDFSDETDIRGIISDTAYKKEELPNL